MDHILAFVVVPAVVASPIMLKRDELRDRLIDARTLWTNGRRDGAFIQSLIALAGLSRLRYPKKTTPPKVYFDKMREYHPAQKNQIDEGEKKQKKPRLGDGQQFKCMFLDRRCPGCR